MAYELVARFALGSSAVHAVVQNNDDLLWLVGNGLVPRDRITVTYGSGVVVNDYLRLASAEKRRVVILAGRLLKDKGVYEFVEAARILRRKGIQWRFALVGAADYNNPTSVPQKEIEGWVKEGIVEWWGYRADMMSVFEEAGIVCLPSYYGEGMPKVLLEAAAAGRPVVTTDSVGCREAIIPGKTGLLVRAGDAVDTANALETLIGNEDLRIEFARAGRTLAIEKFEVLTVVRQMLNIYDGVMDAPAAASANAA
jgi:glycosyltransferase involved in cell wall biosynthesis